MVKSLLLKKIVNSIDFNKIPKTIVREARTIKHLVKIDYIKKDKIHFIIKYTKEEISVYYFLKKNAWICDCIYFTLNQKPCKHIIASYLFIKEKLKRLNF